MISLEEEHCMKYKTHMFITNLSYRFGSFLFVYMLIYASFLLGDMGAITNSSTYEQLCNPNPEDDEI